MVMLAGFVLLAVVAVVGLRRGAASSRLGDVLVRLQDSTAQIRVRAAILALVGFVVLAGRFGLETILGAFVAGAVVGLIDRDSASHPHFRMKLEAVAFLRRQREAHDAARVGNHEVDRGGRAFFGGDDQVAFVFAVLVIDQHDHAAGLEFLDRFWNRAEWHSVYALGSVRLNCLMPCPR